MLWTGLILLTVVRWSYQDTKNMYRYMSSFNNINLALHGNGGVINDRIAQSLSNLEAKLKHDCDNGVINVKVVVKEFFQNIVYDYKVCGIPVKAYTVTKSHDPDELNHYFVLPAVKCGADDTQGYLAERVNDIHTTYTPPPPEPPATSGTAPTTSHAQSDITRLTQYLDRYSDINRALDDNGGVILPWITRELTALETDLRHDCDQRSIKACTSQVTVQGVVHNYKTWGVPVKAYAVTRSDNPEDLQNYFVLPAVKCGDDDDAGYLKPGVQDIHKAMTSTPATAAIPSWSSQLASPVSHTRPHHKAAEEYDESYTEEIPGQRRQKPAQRWASNDEINGFITRVRSKLNEDGKNSGLTMKDVPTVPASRG